MSTDALDWTPGHGLPLDEALEKVGAPVSLPDTRTTGGIVKVALDGTDVSGTPGVMVLYASGIKLMVAHGERDMSDLGYGAMPFTDGRPSPFALREIDGVQVLVCEAGAQVGRNGQIPARARIVWNHGGLAYTLIAPSDEVTAGDLIEIMRTTR